MKNKQKPFKQYIGTKGEDASAGLLRDRGFNILRRNYAVHNVGDIFEVRTRRNIGSYPDSAESVIRKKRIKVMKTAERFIAEKGLYDRNVVFEVIMVTHDAQGNIQRIDFVPF